MRPATAQPPTAQASPESVAHVATDDGGKISVPDGSADTPDGEPDAPEQAAFSSTVGDDRNTTEMKSETDRKWLFLQR